MKPWEQKKRNNRNHHILDDKNHQVEEKLQGFLLNDMVHHILSGISTRPCFTQQTLKANSRTSNRKGAEVQFRKGKKGNGPTWKFLCLKNVLTSCVFLSFFFIFAMISQKEHLRFISANKNIFYSRNPICHVLILKKHIYNLALPPCQQAGHLF